MKRWTAALLWSCLAWPAVALADDKPSPAAVQEARSHFTRGVDLFRDGDFHAAKAEFDRAYGLVPNYKLLYNIGQACAEGRDYPCALKSFDGYLTQGKGHIPEPRRKSVQADVDRFRQLVATVTVHVSTDGAEVSVDDVPVGTSPLDAPVVVSAGQRKFTATFHDLSTTRVTEVAGGDTVVVEMEIHEAPPPPPPAPPPAPPAEQQPPAPPPIVSIPVPPPPRNMTPFWIAAGTTVALGSAAAVTGFLTLNKRSDLESSFNQFPLDVSASNDLRSQVSTLGLVTDVLAGAAVAGGAVAVVMFLSQPDRPSSAWSPAVGPGGVGVSF